MVSNNLISYEKLPLVGDKYDETNFGSKIGTSDCNEYMPFYSILNHQLLDVNNNIIIEYGKPTYRLSGGYSRTYTELFNDLIGINYSGKTYQFTIGGVGHSIGYNRHVIFDNTNKILCCLAVKSSALLNNRFSELQENQNPDDYILLVNNDLISNPIYKNVGKKINNEYISRFKTSNIDIVYTNNVDKWVFKNNFRQPTHSNMPAMLRHLNEEVPEILIEN